MITYTSHNLKSYLYIPVDLYTAFVFEIELTFPSRIVPQISTVVLANNSLQYRISYRNTSMITYTSHNLKS